MTLDARRPSTSSVAPPQPSSDASPPAQYRRARRIAATVKRALQMIIRVLEVEFEV